MARRASLVQKAEGRQRGVGGDGEGAAGAGGLRGEVDGWVDDLLEGEEAVGVVVGPQGGVVLDWELRGVGLRGFRH